MVGRQGGKRVQYSVSDDTCAQASRSFRVVERGQYRVYRIAGRSNHELKAAQCAKAQRPVGQRQYAGMQ